MTYTLPTSGGIASAEDHNAAINAEIDTVRSLAFSSRWAVARPHAGYTAGSTDLSISVSGTTMTVEWANLRLVDGTDGEVRDVQDLSSTDLTAGQALYIADGATYSSGWPVSTGTVSGLGADAVTGGDVLLLGNWPDLLHLLRGPRAAWLPSPGLLC